MQRIFLFPFLFNVTLFTRHLVFGFSIINVQLIDYLRSNNWPYHVLPTFLPISEHFQPGLVYSSEIDPMLSSFTEFLANGTIHFVDERSDAADAKRATPTRLPTPTAASSAVRSEPTPPPPPATLPSATPPRPAPVATPKKKTPLKKETCV